MYTVHTLATYTRPVYCVAHSPTTVMPSRARARGGAPADGSLKMCRANKGVGRARAVCRPLIVDATVLGGACHGVGSSTGQLKQCDRHTPRVPRLRRVLACRQLA